MNIKLIPTMPIEELKKEIRRSIEDAVDSLTEDELKHKLSSKIYKDYENMSDLQLRKEVCFIAITGRSLLQYFVENIY
jgi:hypothetical protein